MSAARADRIAGIQRLADALAGDVRAFAEEQTLAEHIRDRGEWTGLEMDARRLSKAVAVMGERALSQTGDVFEGTKA